MGSGARVALLTVRGAGVLALILGLLFWGGDARGLVPVHMLLGLIVAVALGVLGVAAITDGRVGLGVVGLVVAVLLLVVGLGQQQMLPADGHWIVQVVHILLGMGAIGCGEVIGKRLGLTPARAHGA